jgi:hypothetical protein
MHFAAEDLTSQHFWDQMHAVPVAKLVQRHVNYET